MSEDEIGASFVYYCYCAHGGLLYVGVSTDPQRRAQQHRRAEPWWHEVDYITAFRYPTRLAALEVERAAIRHGRPVYNRTHQAGAEPLPCEVTPHDDAWDLDSFVIFDGAGREV